MQMLELQIEKQGGVLYKFNSYLDGKRYYFRMRYNKRNDNWYMSLLDEAGTPLASDIACLTNVRRMFQKYQLGDYFLYGDVFISDLDLAKKDPSFNNFGLNVSCYYMSVLDEILEALAV